jgi:aminoglycoside 6'-N-acetyltransferase
VGFEAYWMSAEDLSFRPLRHEDLALLGTWLARPHIDAWWHGPLDLDGVRAKYAPRIEGTEPTHVFLIEHDAQAIGWIQWYLWADYAAHAILLGADATTAGVDLALGEASLLGVGIGPRALRAFVDGVIFAHPTVTACIADPDTRNLRSIRAFEKAGFVASHTVNLPREPAPRRVFRLDR